MRVGLYVVALALLATTRPAAAAGSEAEDDPLWRLPVANPLGIGVGWDEGVVYGLDEPLKVRGRVGATLDLDAGAVAGDIGDGSRIDLRRFRFYTQGRLYRLGDPAYRFRFGVEESEVFLYDFYLRWIFEGRRFDTVRLGYFRPPASLQSRESSSSLSLMEKASPVAAFEPGFRLGAEVAGSRAKPDLSWQLGLTSIGQSDQSEGDASQSGLRANGRLVWRPWHDETRRRSLLHLGLSVGYTLSGSAGIRYRARPESFLVDFLVDTGDIDGDAAVVGLEALWRRKELRVQAEVFRSFVTVSGPNADLGGAYLEIGRVLTGEHRPYERGLAVMGRVVPAHPLRLRAAGWGALEATARLSWLDLDDGSVRGGRMFSANLGLVLTANQYARIHLGGVYAHTHRNGRSDASWILQTRLELRF